MFGFSWEGLILSVLFLLLFPGAVIDWKHLILPDEITLFGLVLGLVLALFSPHISILNALLGAITGGGLLLILTFFYPGGMGGGDVKLMAMVGSFLGWQLALGTIFLGAVLGILYYVLQAAKGQASRKMKLPFGSFLAAGAFLAYFCGQEIWDWYLGLFI